ncbi:HRDC domain-containing protein [Candidatus Woesearchaeota archaeon]|nr:HRDC domain-containing protein [Candidatus Woesearchaeota archaeon]
MVSFTLVERDAQLRGLVQQWRRARELAIDLEMEAHLHHYGVHLSLVQVSDGKCVWVVDMLAITDPSSLVALFEDARVVKVFHDVSFDFRVLEELLGCNPKNIFDTKVAALLAGRETISLGGLLEEEFGVVKQEKFQRVDWLERPLSRERLAYAAGDVEHLLRLKAVLVKELRSLGRLSWCEEECRYLERSSHKAEERTFDDVKGAKALSEQRRGVLRELYKEREKLARRLDKPVFFVISDKLLVALAKQSPRSARRWQSLKGVHPAVRRAANRFASAVCRAKPAPRMAVRRRRLSRRQRSSLDALLDRRDAIARRLGLEPHLVLSKEQAIAVVTNGGGPRAWQRSLLSLT